MHEQHDSPAQVALSPLEEAKLRLGVMTVLQSRVAEAVDAVRAEVHGLTSKGETHVIAHPDYPARQIASVNHSNPKARAEVVDRPAVDGWISENHKAKTETKWKIIGSHVDVVDALREHAPFLVEEVTEVPEWARNQLLLKCATAGEPVGFGGELGEHAPPGIRVWQPDGVLTVKPSPDATAVVEALWIDQRMDLDGNLLELPAGGAE